MRAEELKCLRLESGMTQAEAARAIGATPSAYTAYERGAKPIPDEVSYIAGRRLGKSDVETDELMLALGEAVLLLDEKGRDALVDHVRRETVLRAVADVTLARCRGSVAEAVGERDMRIRQLEARA